VKPSRNCAHSRTGAPFVPICCRSESDKAVDSTRKPLDPVSTSTPSIVWQTVDWPGAQIVTLVKAPSK